MKSKLFRLISMVLVVVMLINMLPVSVFAEQYQESQLEASIAEANTVTDAQITEEVISGRTEFSKEFMLDNGLRVAALYAEAVHYDAGGTWEEIDNTLKSQLDGTFTNTAGLWDVAFPRILNGAKEITITKDGYTLSFGMAGELRQQGNLEIMSNDDMVQSVSVPEETVAPETESTPLEETTPPETEETQAEETAEVDKDTQASSASQSTEEAETVSAESAAPEETVPETTIPEETVPETTVPEETVPETTAPEETQPETTVPEETAPETTEAAPELDTELSISANTATVTVNGVSQTFAVSEAQSAMGIVQSIDKTEALAAAEHAEFVLSKSASRLLYSNIYGTTDIQYDLRGNQLKESIILEAYSSTLRGYRYTLNVGTMLPVLNDDGSIYFYDEDEEEVLLVMPAPYLVDANHEFNHDIHISLTGSNGTYTLIYLLPQAWLADSDRAWPVVLDPIVSTESDVLNIKDRTIASNGTFEVGSYYLEVGHGTNDGIERAYLKYDNLPAITSSDVILDAQLRMYKPEVSNNGSTVVEVHRVLEPWESETITWAANVNNFDPAIEDFAVVSDVDYYVFNVTDIVRDWYSGENNGLMLKADAAGESGTNTWKRFYSSDIGSMVYLPMLTTTFSNTTGIEDHWDYATASAGRAGTGYVNTFSGNLTFVRSDIGFGGNRMPVSISHTYNTNEAGQNIFGMGTGWRTNYNQRVYQWDEDSDYYIWEDGDGTQHYFERSYAGSSVFKDQDGLEMTLRINISERYDYPGAEKFYVADKYGNYRYFDANGRLISQVNNQKTKSFISITYGTNGYISTITDGAGRKYQFTYNTSGLLTRIGYLGSGTSEISHVAFAYDNDNRLTGITDKDAETCLYTYNDANMLLTAQDIDSYTLTYDYNAPNDTYQTWRVCNVSAEQDSTPAGSLAISYAHNMTTLTDHNGNKEIRQFNDYGNVVSIQDDEGRAQYADYAVNSAADTGKNNQLTLSSKLQYTVSNLFEDSSLENNTVWSAADASATGTSSTAQAYTGSKSMKLVTTASSALVSQTITVPVGESYSFSAYVKATQGTAGLGIRDVNNTRVMQRSPEVTPADGWQRVEVSYTNTSNTSTTIYLAFYGNGSTTAYMDCVQLENTPTASRYNLVENGDFRYDDFGWTANNDDKVELYVPNASTVDLAAPQLDGKVYQFTGDALNKLNLSQTVNISGSEGDTFVIAGWAKGEAAALAENEDYPREYGIVATFNYADDDTSSASDEDEPKKFVAQFNPNMGENGPWQYSAEVMVAEKDYESITVAVTYDHNIHTVKFDGIQLYKEEFGSSYTYDEDGNVISVVDLQKQETTYEYTNNDLTKEILPSGAELEYKYDSYHNVTQATSAEGMVYKFTYDDYGNNTSVSITGGSNSTETITSQAHYTTDGNYTDWTKDAAGNITYYNYHTDTGVLNWVQYPNDTSATKTAHEYDEMYRMESVEATTSSNLNLSAAYSYTNDLLTKITTPTTTYNLGYGPLGLRSNIIIGSNTANSTQYTLATYTYTGDQNKYLDTLAYGNGNSVEYTYDDHGRVLTETYEDDDVISYKYDNSGALATVTDSATGRTTTYYYDFTDRMMKYVESGTDFSHTVGYEYDEQNNLSSQVETVNGETRTVSYTYDDDNRLTQTQDGSSVRTYSYDGFGRLASYVTRYDGATKLTQNYTYRTTSNGATSQVASVEYDNINNDYDITYSYTYDANGNITSVITTDDEGKTLTTTYVYDSANQLIRENNQAGDFTRTWTYDNGGNITSRKEYAYTTGTLGAVETADTYVYGDSAWGDLLTKYNDNPLSYDDVGNLTGDVTWRYTWHHGRQLASMAKKDGSETWSFTYDASGMRTSRTKGSKTYEYVYNGGQLTGMVMKSGTSVSNTLRISYDSGKPMFLKLNGVTYQYVTNVQGDVIAILNSSGVPVVEYTYDAWGNILDIEGSLSSTVGIINPLRYRGYVYDQETGLYYLQSRYYNPNWCRFINADNYPTTGQGLLGNNMFAYCNNNPVIHEDSEGTALDTVLDIISLASSIVDVAQNPNDPWAWIGLAGDIIDVAVPFVGGVGEVVRAASAARKALDAADQIHDTAKLVEQTTDAVKTLHRPYIRKSTRQAVEAAADRLPDGRFLDFNTQLPINGKYDLGHKYGHEFWRERDRAMSLGWSQKQFNDYMNNPDFYQIEDPFINRSHRFEMR